MALKGNPKNPTTFEFPNKPTPEKEESQLDLLLSFMKKPSPRKVSWGAFSKLLAEFPSWGRRPLWGPFEWQRSSVAVFFGHPRLEESMFGLWLGSGFGFTREPPLGVCCPFGDRQTGFAGLACALSRRSLLG